MRVLWFFACRRCGALRFWLASIFLEQLLGGVVLGRLLQAFDCAISFFGESLDVGVGAGDTPVVEACRDGANNVDTGYNQPRSTQVACHQEETYSNGPPATAVYSVRPQFLYPTTSDQNRAAKMYANPAQSVHMTRIRLDLWRMASLRAAARWILPVSVESVFSK